MPFQPYVTYNDEKYRVHLPSYHKRDATRFAPPIRQGYPSGATMADESEVGWEDWSGGAFQAKYLETGLNRYAFGIDVWPIAPGQVVLGPERQTATGISAAVTLLKTPLTNGRIAALTATEVFLRDAGANSFDSKLAAVTPTDIIEFDGNVYVGMGSSNAYRYTADITPDSPAWTTSNLGAGGNAQFANLWAADLPGTGASGGRLWKSVNPNNVYSSADPRNTTGAWTSTYLVGSSNWNINSLRIIDNRLIVAKPEGIFWLLPAGTVEPLLSFRDAIHTDNGLILVQAHNGLILANWMHGLIAFRPGATAATVTVQEVWRQLAPSLRTNETEAQGRFVAAVAGPTLTWFILNNTLSGNYYLVAWTGEDIDRGWHVIHGFGGSNASVIGFEQPNAGRARIYTRQGGSSPFFFDLPRDTDEPRNDTGFTYRTSGFIEMSEYESPLPEMNKMYRALRLRLENLAAGTRYADVTYFLDGGTETAFSRIETTGSSTLYFPSNTSGRRLRIRIYLYGTASASPRLRAVYLAFKFTPDAQLEWVMDVLSAPGVGDVRTSLEVESDLRSDKATNSAFSFRDLDGSQYLATLESIDTQPLEMRHGEEAPQWSIALRMLQQTGTAVGACYADNESAVLEECFAA